MVEGQGGRTDLPKTTVLISWETVLEHKFPSSQANYLSDAALQKEKIRIVKKFTADRKPP